MKTQCPLALMRIGQTLLFAAAFALVLAAHLPAQDTDAGAQQVGGAQGAVNIQIGAARTPRAASPQDLTGYWESIVTEYWRYRMVIPDKGDYVIVPLNAEARKIADAWDPAKDQADGNQCRAYGAAAIMQVPGRLHIYWQDDNTLRIDADSGTQTRLLHFGGSAPANAAADWQGYSSAFWEGYEPDNQRNGGGGPVRDPRDLAKVVPREVGGVVPGYLKVLTNHLRPGYLRKNGVPYGANATVEESFDRFSDPYSHENWLVVTTVVTDPQYLMEPYVTHAHFKKIADGAGWDPTPCRSDEPR